jgi:hypothetical protein
VPLREAAPGLPNRRDVVAVTWRRPGKYLETDGSPQHISRLGKVHRATATWAEHHLLWIDRAFPSPSRARYVRWIATGLPSVPFVTSATIIGQK